MLVLYVGVYLVMVGILVSIPEIKHPLLLNIISVLIGAAMITGGIHLAYSALLGMTNGMP